MIRNLPPYSYINVPRARFGRNHSFRTKCPSILKVRTSWIAQSPLTFESNPTNVAPYYPPTLPCYHVSQYSGQPTCRTTDKSGLSLPGRSKAFSLLHSVRTSNVDHSASKTMNTGVLSAGVKCRGVRLNSPRHLHGAVLNQAQVHPLTLPVKINFSRWTEDVEDISLL
jgi:hypothetical protein